MYQEHEITICLGSSCFSRGNKSTLDIIKSYVKDHQLQVKMFFHGDLCNGLCDKGPIIKIDDKLFYEVTSENIYDILTNYFNSSEND